MQGGGEHDVRLLYIHIEQLAADEIVNDGDAVDVAADFIGLATAEEGAEETGEFHC